VAGNDWTKDNAATMQNDGYKVHAVLNEIDGYDHSGAPGADPWPAGHPGAELAGR
jgi:hypothetical protein